MHATAFAVPLQSEPLPIEPLSAGVLLASFVVTGLWLLYLLR
jgi:hypothetical protein